MWDSNSSRLGLFTSSDQYCPQDSTQLGTSASRHCRNWRMNDVQFCVSEGRWMIDTESSAFVPFDSWEDGLLYNDSDKRRWIIISIHR